MSPFSLPSSGSHLVNAITTHPGAPAKNLDFRSFWFFPQITSYIHLVFSILLPSSWSNPPASHLSFLSWHYVSSLVSLQSLRAVKEMSPFLIGSLMFSHCLWNKPQTPCHVCACRWATSTNLARDSPATLPSFVPSICQTLSCPRTFAGVLLSAGNTLYSIQLLYLLHSMCLSMYVYIYSLTREKTVTTWN